MFSAKRKVRSNGKTVVGEISSLKRKAVQFESGLEEELIYILDFDSDVKSYHDQPIQITYQDEQGKERIYTPDYLVEYKDGSKVLFEVKSKEFIAKNQKEYRRIVKAGKGYCKSRSWIFKVITDRDIMTDYGANVRFLFYYQTYPLDLAISNVVLGELKKLGKSTPGELALKLSAKSEEALNLISAIWILVKSKQISCDLFQPIHMETPISVSTTKRIKELKYPYKS